MEMPGGFERLGEAGKGSSDGSMDHIKGLGLDPCLSSRSPEEFMEKKKADYITQKFRPCSACQKYDSISTFTIVFSSVILFLFGLVFGNHKYYSICIKIPQYFLL